MVRVVEADRTGIPAVQIFFLDLIDIGYGRVPDILAPGVNLNAAFFGCGNHHFENIYIAVVRRFRVFDDGVLVILRVRRCVVTTVETLVDALNAMVRERMALKLAAGNTVSIGESRQEIGLPSPTKYRFRPCGVVQESFTVPIQSRPASPACRGWAVFKDGSGYIC